MRKPTDRKAASHAHIVDAASRAVRRLGFHGVAVADVMHAAKLTHGGFYGHFDSREALLSEAVDKAGVEFTRMLHERILRYQSAGSTPLRGLVETYLSMEHVTDYDAACPLSLLSSDMFRQRASILARSQALVENHYRLVTEVLPPEFPPQDAWLIASTLIGAVQLARTTLSADPGRASAILSLTRSGLLERYDNPAR